MRLAIGLMFVALGTVGCGDAQSVITELCEGVVCDDGNACTNDVCDPSDGQCDFLNAEDGRSCDFGGLPGVCDSGTCVDAELCEGVSCDVPCAVDEPPCDPFTGTCPPPTIFVETGSACDLDTVDDGLCDGQGLCIEPQGDLEPIGIAFDENNFLQILIKNRSSLEVPANRGNVQVFVDGQRIADIDLGSLADDSYRQPNSLQTITLETRLAGTNRRIGALVDTRNDILETDEDHNQYTHTLTPPACEGPDLVVSDLRVEGLTNTLHVQLRNDGNRDSSATNVQLLVRVDGTLVADVTESIPSLSAGGGSISICPSPPITIQAQSKVKVTVVTQDPYDEIDHTNQSRTEFLPSPMLPAEYLSLLVHPRIANNLKWENASGVEGLTDVQMAELLDAVLALEVEQPIVPPLPPPDFQVTEETAWQIFVAHVAHSLWAEVHDVVDWKLVNMSDDDVASLLDGRQWFDYSSTEDRYLPLYGGVTPWNPSADYEFLRNFGIIRETQVDTILALTDWVRARLYHTAGEDRLEQYGYEGLPPTDRMLYPLEDKRHVTLGCSGTSGLMVTSLRTINIPGEMARTIFDGSAHCRPSFPDADRSMAHGDDPYNSIMMNSSGTVPIQGILYDLDDMEGLFLSPLLDCNAGVCNTVGEQALYNATREKISHSFAHRGDYLFRQYALYGPDHLREVTLEGIPVGGKTVTYVYPLFSESEKGAMIAAIGDYLTRLGGGDISVGKAIVSDRVYTWYAAKGSLGDDVRGDPVEDDDVLEVDPLCSLDGGGSAGK